jgi:hypothetical protein
MSHSQVSWNCPFQMGTDSSLNPKEHGDSYNYDLKKNDVIVIATDGLWDNLSNPEITALLKVVILKCLIFVNFLGSEWQICRHFGCESA